MKVEKGTRYRVTEIRVLLSLFLYFDIITIIIRQLGIEILLLLTIAREIGFSLCLLFFFHFSYARGIARLRKTEMMDTICR